MNDQNDRVDAGQLARALAAGSAWLLAHHAVCGEGPVAQSHATKGFPPAGWRCPRCGVERQYEDEAFTYSWKLNGADPTLPVIKHPDYRADRRQYLARMRQEAQAALFALTGSRGAARDGVVRARLHSALSVTCTLSPAMVQVWFHPAKNREPVLVGEEDLSGQPTKEEWIVTLRRVLDRVDRRLFQAQAAILERTIVTEPAETIIVVEITEYVGRFFIGSEKYHASLGRPETARGEDWMVGNAAIACSEIDHLRLLGHTVEIIDLSEEY